MAKIKIDKNGIGDIRQLTKNPDNPYVRDEEQITNLINSFEEKKESGEVRLNNYSIRCYSDGVIKGGNSRWDAGMESGNYFLHIDIDPKSSTEASKKEKVKDLLDDNIKRKDKWEDRVLCYKLWEDAEQEERDIEKIPVKDKTAICKKLGTSWDTMRDAISVYENDKDLFDKVDAKGMGITTVIAAYKQQSSKTNQSGQSVEKSKQNVDFINKSIIEQIISATQVTWDKTLDVEIPISKSKDIHPYNDFSVKVRSTIISTLIEKIGANIFIENGTDCQYATGNFRDKDWFFPTKSLPIEIKVAEFDSLTKTHWNWNKIKGGHHILIVHSDVKRWFVVKVNLEKANFTEAKSAYDSNKVYLNQILDCEHEVLIGEIYDDAKHGIQVNLVTV